MTIHVALHHRTSYRYDRLIGLGPQTLRLRPAPHCRTPIISYSLKVEPAKHFINWQQDPYGNYLARIVFPERTREFTIDVDLVADVAVINPFDFFLEPAAERFPFNYEPVLACELAPYLEREPAGPHFDAYVAGIDRSSAPTSDFLVDLNRRLQEAITYGIRLEPGVQSCEETLTLRSGSCRDTAWLLVQILRRLGLAARFVSGYLIQLKPDVKPLEGPAGAAADFTDLHAWAEVYLPGAGWIGLDPTSGLLTSEGHIPLAATAFPSGAAPVSGGLDPCETEFGHEMRITRIRETPRVTKPYEEAEWQRIEKLGHAVDAKLKASGLNLTMGGEPTFVSVDDMEGEEWNTAALGPTKRQRAGELLRRLQHQWAPGALLHYGQGKWYPGEQLPRWALGCYWRRDGEPVWKDPSLLAADEKDGDGEQDGATIADTEAFGEALTRRLGLDPSFLIKGFEDVWYYLWRERRLPADVDPLESKLDDPLERQRLARIFEQGLEQSVGLTLPLQRVRDPVRGDGWASGRWPLRAERMYLHPGDSPMGLRLPLDSLPKEAESGDDELQFEVDPFQPRAPLPPRDSLGRNTSGIRNQGPVVDQKSRGRARLCGAREKAPVAVSIPESPEPIRLVRTALCLEPRDGVLHIFMPPVTQLEDYLDLLAAVEDTAAALGRKVVVEGYAPPRDPRLRHFSITPDPGVIEANVEPASNWGELVRNTEVLYEEARQIGLGTEKFMLDGRHVGTGGGNHVVLGGPSADESPLLRRPDLLRSLIGYWLNHPSLSYLFSGLHVGPTSQAPRIDEARSDAVAQLELAFTQIPEAGTEVAPWIIDRVLRNILVDVTGNTHRTEFCIDKLYSPDSPTGRLGLLELRAFEMPPHARMSLVQQLLVRSLVAGFAERPYRKPPIRWGTQLHDRFMLPHYLREDFASVIADLREMGHRFESSWFAPHFEFRFPEIGAVSYCGIVMELRQAIEPWPVLGEEPGGGSTVRYVDSSLERMQVRVTGLTGGRHLIACNGVRLPLHPTSIEGEFVAGIRYRAWAPTSALHPTIGTNVPLILDIVDSWTERSIGGCAYHVAHPGGRTYETFPVNSYEAEARRRARFFKTGHTPGSLVPAQEWRIGEFPVTLDLRYASGANG